MAKSVARKQAGGTKKGPKKNAKKDLPSREAAVASASVVIPADDGSTDDEAEILGLEEEEEEADEEDGMSDDAVAEECVEEEEEKDAQEESVAAEGEVADGEPETLPVQSWEEFGQKHIDRRITRALTKTMGLQRPTLVQQKSIPLLLEGKDVLCKAKTGSGKTLSYCIPMVARVLRHLDAGEGGDHQCLGVVLVPTKDLVAQVHAVLAELLSFTEMTVDSLVFGQNYLKAELPTIVVATPASLMDCLTQRGRKLSNMLFLVIDEADLMLTYGFEQEMQKVRDFLPAHYQAMLFSATLNEEVHEIKNLLLHKPVTLKIEAAEEEAHSGGTLTHFYLPVEKDDKYLLLYALLKLKLVAGKVLVFCKDIDTAYQYKLLFDKFSLPSAVLNSDLCFESRQNVIQAFNTGLVEVVIATDEGFEQDELQQQQQHREKTLVSVASGTKQLEEEDLDRDYFTDSEDERERQRPVRMTTRHIKLEEPEEADLIKLPVPGEDGESDDDDIDVDDICEGGVDSVSEDDDADDDDDDDASSDDDGGEGAGAKKPKEEEKSSGGEKKAKKTVTKKTAAAEDSDDDDELSGADFSDMSEGEDDPMEQDSEEEEDEDEDEDDADMGSGDKVPKAHERRVIEKMQKKQYSSTRGLDFKNVETVINADMPKTIRSYIHRVGRTARAGQSGTALTLVTEKNEKQMALIEAIRDNFAALFPAPAGQPEDESRGLELLPFDVSTVERLRYRVNDVARGITRKNVQKLRMEEIQREAMHSHRLKKHFAANPQDLLALKKAQRALKTGRNIQAHLAHLPAYLLRDLLGEDGAQQYAAGGYTAVPITAAASRGVKKGGKKKFTVGQFARIRTDPTADPATLPPLAGRKIWKMNHKKALKKPSREQYGSHGRKFGRSARQRKKRFNV